eukprot:jgi/Chrpa1/13829/Chrysochromulina_OHIO_Genome00003331-RA
MPSTAARGPDFAPAALAPAPAPAPALALPRPAEYTPSSARRIRRLRSPGSFSLAAAAAAAAEAALEGAAAAASSFFLSPVFSGRPRLSLSRAIDSSSVTDG